MLHEGGFAYLAERAFGVCSEGERQQVLLARSLMVEPEFIVLDEPFAGLDLGARERLLTRLGALGANANVPAFLLVTHHLEEVPPGITHAALLQAGRLVAAGPVDQVLTSELVSATFDVDVEVDRIGNRWSARARFTP